MVEFGSIPNYPYLSTFFNASLSTTSAVSPFHPTFPSATVDDRNLNAGCYIRLQITVKTKAIAQWHVH